MRDLESSGFNRQIHNVGFLDETGRLSPQTYSGLDHWIRVSRSEDPTQQIVLWISGDEDMHVNNHVSHDQIAAFLSELMSTSGADGLLLDLEPFGRDNVNLLQLLEAVRVRLPSTWLGITAPATEGTWSAGFVSSLANTVDALSPMLYDTSLKNADAYQAFVTAAVASFSTATASKAALIPSLPAYAANRWHDPSVESIANASVSLNAASAPEIHGAAVYWWWEMDAAAKADWLAAISG